MDIPKVIHWGTSHLYSRLKLTSKEQRYELFSYARSPDVILSGRR